MNHLRIFLHKEWFVMNLIKMKKVKLSRRNFKNKPHNVIKKSTKLKLKYFPPESMSKSKKNTIDPEVMINAYGAAVRWFI